MKQQVTFLLALLISVATFAQQGFNYKAIIKDTNGNVLAGTFMNVQFTIHESTAIGTIVYQEDDNYTTDANGLLILNIGSVIPPSVGVFTSIDWGAALHFLQTTITYAGGTINFDSTEFMAVPYAKHAETAGNIFSGDYNDLTNQPTITTPGLLRLNEQGGPFDSGHVLSGRVSSTFGPLGSKAVDLSYNGTTSPSTTRGATGRLSFATGLGTTASGDYATAMGFSTTASGDYATAMGRLTNAESVFSTAIGRFNIGGFTDNTGTNNDGDTIWFEEDPLFEIGNGLGTDNRSNALTVLKNGTITAPSLSIAEINNAGDKALVTKEYVEGLAPIAYGVIDSNGNILSGTGNFTVTTIQSPTFQIEVTGETLSHLNSSTLVTPLSGLFRTAGITHSNGDVRVYIFNSSGTQVINTFQFVIYKLQ